MSNRDSDHSPTHSAGAVGEWEVRQRLVAHRREMDLRNAEVEVLHERVSRRDEFYRSFIQRLEGQLKAARDERDAEALTARVLRAKLAVPRDARRSGIGSDAPRNTARFNSRASQYRQVRETARLAGIFDEFTASVLSPSCEICALDLYRWRDQLVEFKPDMLFIESAWHGNSGQWSRKIHQFAKEFSEVLQWCEQQQIPTVFWNKEDPVHFDTFINVAKRFDFVFTTALECISSYKTLLGHERVYLMPFWGQPKVHSPIERFERKDGFCFAGAYYQRYPERQQDFDALIDALSSLMPVEIYDRNHGKDDPNYMFPERYQKFILGTLSYSEIDKAYKGYRFGLNLNSVKQSQSMFARRVFDLMLCNTHVISNYSRGLRLLFGDLVTSTDSGAAAADQVRDLLSPSHAVSPLHLRRLLALRKVMLEHTAECRISYMYEKVFGFALSQVHPEVVVVACVSNEEEVRRIWSAYSRQSWSRKRLLLVLDELADQASVDMTRGRADVRIFNKDDAVSCEPAKDWSGEVVAFFSVNDYYGQHYLTDLALGFSYSTAEVVGKGSWYQLQDDTIELQQDGARYRWQASLPVRRSMALASAFSGCSLSNWTNDVEGCEISGESCLALDEFNYVADTERDDFPELSEDSIDTGIPLSVMLEAGEDVRGMTMGAEIEVGLNVQELLSLFGKNTRAGAVTVRESGGALVVRSELEPEERQYIYAAKLLDVDEVSRPSGEMIFNLVAMPGLQLDAVFVYFSGDGERLGHAIRPFGRNHTEMLPQETRKIQFGFRVLGPGVARVAGLSLVPLQWLEGAVPHVGRARSLVLTNAYPSATRLYRNGFVHRRVVGYRDIGIRTDVFVLDPRARSISYEHEGVDVTVGDERDLEAVLSNERYESILVHFLDAVMWEKLRVNLPKLRVIVWIHGAEIQPWHRRTFNYSTAEELEGAKRASVRREELWSGIFSNPHPNLHFVFVSRYLAEEVMTDYEVRIPRQKYSIIHNVIDSHLFPYREKDAEMRFKVLSIRPYSSRKYANDLTIRAIELLRDKPYFSKMEFRLVGQGPLLDDVVAPLRSIDNVIIDPRFLTQSEIAELHGDHGIFLTPTRWDSQGVSRDEAMASGLVPVTNRTSAIPEFMDESCGFMVPEEDAQALADAISELVENPDLFLKMSRAAATRPRHQTPAGKTIHREAELFAFAPGREILPKTRAGLYVGD